MACDQEILILISAYADGETTPEESTRAKTHLDTCPDCRRMVKDWQEERQLLEWAYTLELPQEITIPTEGSRVGAETRRQRRGFTINWRWNWAAVGMLAAVMLMAVIGINYYKHRPYVLGSSLVTGNNKQIAQVAEGIQIEVGQDSKVTRIDEKTIRLDAGWLRATVNQTNGFQILTKRIKIMDIGTKFQVITGPKIDTVSVEEGVVDVYRGHKSHRVNAGQCLVAKNDAPLSIIRIPISHTETHTESKGTLIADQVSKLESSKEFVPRQDSSFDQVAGLQSLHKRFPYIRLSGASKGSCRKMFFSEAAGARAGVRKHCGEIAQAISGGRTCDDWEIPVGVALMTDISAPVNLTADSYYIQLASTAGRLVWRLKGSNGSSADIPISIKVTKTLSNAGDHSGINNLISDLNEEAYTLYGLENHGEGALLMACWPGESKPALSLNLCTKTLNKTLIDRAKIRSEVDHEITGVRGFCADNDAGFLYYLDLGRNHRVFILPNSEIDGQLERIRRRPGSALVCVVATDLPLLEPKIPAGVYLVRLVKMMESEKSYLEIASPEGDVRVKLADWSSLNNSPFWVDSLKLMIGDNASFNISTDQAIKSSYPFQLCVSMSNLSGSCRGCFRVCKP